ncbi:MAG: ATP-binding cassette domain-containing protein [Saprospiraceae bacterium]
MSIKVNNLYKSFGDQVVLNDISFEANKSQILGFLGPNGAGKTTTMRIITGSLISDGGEVFVSGINVQDDPLEAKKKVGYLAEHNPLYGEMYVREFLGFVSDIYKISDKKNRIDEMIEKTGLTKEQNKKLKFLSKGYKQRVGLAQAMIHNPEVLILDEPTSGLDPNQLREIRTLIKEIGHDKTVIFSTHIMQEVQALCDRVIILNGGKIVADGSLSELDNYKSKNLKSVIVEFDSIIDSKMLKGIDSISNFEIITEYSFRLFGEDDKRMKREIFEFAKNNDKVLISVLSENVDIDSVFADLTR